ncbi:hypothetical protein ABZ419_02535 [Streptomyces cinnamoneus]|uniref:hypothetical protein n=1 Tax=Streptomyces cinnamoneus TaxID=53446 RepID=UPI003405D737
MEWQQAVKRADQITRNAVNGSLYPANSWDGRAIRGVLAVVLAGLAERQGCAVADVETGSILWHLDQGPALVYELGKELGLGSESAEPAAAAEEWAWLIRRWPSSALPPRANSDGMTRGIGRGSSEPAVEVCTMWALSVVRDALLAERPAKFPTGTSVRVTGGEDEGRTGTVAGPAWLMDHENRTVDPGGPHGYEVRLSVPGEPEGPQTTEVLEGPLAGLVLRTPGPSGERVIVRADDLVALDG